VKDGGERCEKDYEAGGRSVCRQTSAGLSFPSTSTRRICCWPSSECRTLLTSLAGEIYTFGPAGVSPHQLTAVPQMSNCDGDLVRQLRSHTSAVHPSSLEQAACILRSQGCHYYTDTSLCAETVRTTSANKSKIRTCVALSPDRRPMVRSLCGHCWALYHPFDRPGEH